MTDPIDYGVCLRGCFDPECCGDWVYGIDFECPVCGRDVSAESTIDPQDIYDCFTAYEGETLVLTCDECGFQIKGLVDSGWVDEMEFEKVEVLP